MEEEILDREEETQDIEENETEIEVEVESHDESNIGEEETQETPSKEQEYYDRLIRVTADFDNYKKRILKEKQEFLKYSNERLIKEIIPVIDNIERAIESAQSSSEAKSIVDGLKLILNQLLKTLSREGVVVIESKGEKFDPLIHEAISQIPSKDYPPNTVIEEQLKAYLLNKKLIRAAKVIVSREMPEEEMEDIDKKEESIDVEENVGETDNE